MGLSSPARWLLLPPPEAATRTLSSKHSEACQAHSLSVAHGHTPAQTHTHVRAQSSRCISKGPFPPIPCQVNAKLNVSCDCSIMFCLPPSSTSLLHFASPTQPSHTHLKKKDPFNSHLYLASVVSCSHSSSIPICPFPFFLLLPCFPRMPIGAYVPLQEVIMTVYAREEKGGGTKESGYCTHMALLRRLSEWNSCESACRLEDIALFWPRYNDTAGAATNCSLQK